MGAKPQLVERSCTTCAHKVIACVPATYTLLSRWSIAIGTKILVCRKKFVKRKRKIRFFGSVVARVNYIAVGMPPSSSRLIQSNSSLFWSLCYTMLHGSQEAKQKKLCQRSVARETAVSECEEPSELSERGKMVVDPRRAAFCLLAPFHRPKFRVLQLEVCLYSSMYESPNVGTMVGHLGRGFFSV